MKPSVKKDFIHLHNHSEYSLPDGMSSIKKMVKKAKNLGMKYLAITDNGTMFGALHFYRECKANSIIPIIGCSFEVAFEDKSRTPLILLAKNYTGYKNLILLSSKACTEGFQYKPILDTDFFSQHSSDLICISLCQNEENLNNQYNEVQKKAEYFQSIFGKDNFYLELQDHGKSEQKIINEQLIKLSKETGIPLVATNNTCYLDREDAKARDILFTIRMERIKYGVLSSRFSNGEYFMKTKEEMCNIFEDIPEAIENTIKIAENCKLEIQFPGPVLPKYSNPIRTYQPEEYLRFLIYRGLSTRFSEIKDSIKNRVEYELDTIISMGFTGYFLIVRDYVSYAQKNDIPLGPGRGSSAGSLVSFALGITDIDPLKYGLLFERFINPERISLPDIDIDFCLDRVDEVVGYVTQKYGSDRVAGIGVFDRLKVKGSGDRGLTDTSLRLEGIISHSSVYSSGIVISQKKLTDYIPIYKNKKKEFITTQYEMDFLEDCGLVKFDFLGLQVLSDNKKIEKSIKDKYPDFKISDIPIDDKETLDVFRKGNTEDIFQFTSLEMQDYLKQLNPDSIEDLIALNALYRPGAKKNIPELIEKKNNRNLIVYPESCLEDILKSTYGIIIYQEQAMEIIGNISGFSLGKADILRRAIGARKVQVMSGMKKEFIEGALLIGFSSKKASEIFEMLVSFSVYTFNKSHAAAYTMIAYRTAYLKAHYLEEFQIVHSNKTG